MLGTDNGSAFTARRFKDKLAALGIRHRRSGYRDPESQAFIESWFGKLKEREVWLNEYETLDDARRGIGGRPGDHICPRIARIARCRLLEPIATPPPRGVATTD